MSLKGHYTAGKAITRGTQAADETGGTTLSWATLATVDGFIRQVNAREAELAERIGYRATHRLYTDVTDITNKDRVVDGSTTYEVKAVKNPNERNHHLEIDLEIIT